MIKKIGSLIISISMLTGTLGVLPVHAAQTAAGEWDFNNSTPSATQETAANWQTAKVGDAVSYVDGPMSKTVKFDGSESSYIDMGEIPDAGNWNEVTMSVWIKPTMDQNWEKNVMSLTDANGNMKMSIYLQNNFLSVAWGDSNTGKIGPQINGWTWGYNIPQGEWQNIAVTLNNTQKELNIYRNGTLLGTHTVNLETNNAEYLNIGARLTHDADGNVTAAAHRYNGLLDNVKLYQKALTAEEIKALYDSVPEFVTGGEWDFNNQDALASANTRYMWSATPVIGNLASFVDGPMGKAVKFDGTADSYIDIGKLPDAESWNEVTMSAWIKPTKDKNWERSIMSLTDSSGNMKMSLFLMSGFLCVADGGQWQGHHGPQINGWTWGYGITEDEWQNIAVTYNKTNSELKFYRNGTLLGTHEAALDTTSARYLDIGARLTRDADGNVTSTAHYYNGLLDNVKLYQKALTAEEIKALYDSVPEFVTGGKWDFNNQDALASANTRYMWSTPAAGSAVTYADGIEGKAAKFDGSDNSYIDMGQIPDTGKWTELTMSAWIKPTKDQNWERDVMNLASRDGERMFSVYLMNGFVTVACGGGTVPEKMGYTAESGVQVGYKIGNGGEWEHIAVSYKMYQDDNTTALNSVKIYRNGGLIAEATKGFRTNFDPSYSPLFLNMGANIVRNSDFSIAQVTNKYNGLMDDIRIYKKVLTEDEIFDIYNENTPNKLEIRDIAATDNTVTAKLQNINYTPGSKVTVIAAACDFSSNNLKYVGTAEVTIPENSEKQEFTINGITLEKHNKLRIFVWENLTDTMKPLIEVTEKIETE